MFEPLILFLLVADVSPDGLLVPADCVYEEPTGPKVLAHEVALALPIDPRQGLCQSNGRVVCAWRSTPRPKRPLGRESAPLGQCAGSSLFVDLASDEMALLMEVVVDLGMN